MGKVKVIDRRNENVCYVVTWSEKRAKEWIEYYSARMHIFTDKTLTKEDFKIILE